MRLKARSGSRRKEELPADAGPVPEKKWTTVRRRELINRQQWAAAAAEEAAAKPKAPRKGG